MVRYGKVQYDRVECNSMYRLWKSMGWSRV